MPARRSVLAIAAILSGLVLAGPVRAGEFQDGQAAYRAGDYATALKDWRTLAEQGDAAAAFMVGVAYDTGTGVLRNAAKALKWTRRSAHQGFAPAQDNLGAMYQGGRNVRRNAVKAAKWYRLAAEQGDARAEDDLGGMFAVGGAGVPRNYAKSVKWYRISAETGYAAAQNNLGDMYTLGRGLSQSLAKAAKWYHLAAKQGYVMAQAKLGGMYYFGNGVPRDYIKAYMWLNLAAAQGLHPAAKALNALADRMTPSQIAEAQRRSAAFRPRVAAAMPPARGQAAGDLGSGFFVTASGLAVTNAHVVTGCRRIRVEAGGQAGTVHLLATDRANDLALLATGLHPGAVAPLRLTSQQGDAVAVYGFPLAGLLAPGGNITFGNITALAGPADDSSLLQISAPVQPGNSGGPVLDDNGNVVGIVVAKLNALQVAAATADIPQNVNFAIKAAVLADFLSAHGVAFTAGTLSRRLAHPALATSARNITIEVVCEK